MMIDEAILALRKMGLKVTSQRLAIMETLEGNRNHPSAEDIYWELHQKNLHASLATVYHTLSSLAAAHMILEISTDPTKKRYDTCVTPHHHLYCRVCGRVFHIEGHNRLAEDTVNKVKKNGNGHKIDEIVLDLRGICIDCNQMTTALKRREN